MRYSFKEAICYFLLIDMLFLPRISWPIWIPLSLIPALILQIDRKQLNNIGRLVFFLFFLVAMFMSLINSSNSLFFNENVKRTFQLILTFSYVIPNTKLNLNILRIILYIFFVWIFFLFTMYWISPSTVSMNLIYFFPESQYIHESNLQSLRFSYIFADPNAAGYFFVMVFALYIGVVKKTTGLFFVSFSCVLAVFATQSRGAILSIIAVFLFYYVSDAKKAIYITISLLLAYFAIEKYTLLLDLILYRNEMDLGESRMEKYVYFINNMNYLPYGSGYWLTFPDGTEFRPHSDLIRMILSFGFVALSYVLWVMYPINKKQKILFIPAGTAFLINALLFDFRMFGFYLFSLTILKQINKK